MDARNKSKEELITGIGEQHPISAIAGVGRDITEHNREAKKLSDIEDALRSLHRITSAQNRTFSEKMQELLSMGCRKFGLPIGILAHIEGDKYEVMEVVAPEKAITRGSIFELGKTYCTETLKAHGPVFFEHAAESDWKTHPAYHEFRLEAYIAIPVVVRNKTFGTINFSSPEPRQVSFSSTDQEILKLMAQWVGGELERKRMEEELVRVEKLESLALLAGGIAHDFNNILTAVLGNISLALTLSDPEDETQKVLREAEKATFKAKHLTQQLLTFSRRGAPVKKVASLVEILEDSASLASRGSRVQCNLLVPSDLWPVEADEGQIGQVISNLIINADQAMPDGGTINVSAANLILDKEDPGVPLPAGQYVEIAVEDSGTGIRKEDLRKIFDPYFTTKKEGSGLGLSTAYSIVQKHEGHIAVESEVGKGTCFHVYLPATDKPVPAPATTEKTEHPGRRGRILVMDDDKMIRRVAGEILKRLGFDVTVALSGSEAIDLYLDARNQNRPFDAVILDLTIPGGMGGMETIQKLIGIDPDVKAIVSSGYSNDPIMANFKAHGFRGVVAKPYRLKDLSETLENVLEGSSLPVT